MLSVKKTAGFKMIASVLVAAVVVAAAPAAQAQVAHQPLNALGDHIQIPGFSGRQAFTYDFQLNGFESRNGRLFAIGILSGGNLPSAQQVALPVGTDDRGRNRGRGGGDDFRGGFGGVERGSMSPSPRSPAMLQPPFIQRAVYQQTSAPLVVPAQATQTCEVLNLVLQAVNLNLLGLVVNLQAVVLDIVAVAGPGNLLGNLLCAIVGILD